MLHDLGGLDSNYSSLMSNITSKKRIFGLDELFTLMRTHDRQQERMNHLNSYVVHAKYSKTSLNLYIQMFKLQNLLIMVLCPINQSFKILKHLINLNLQSLKVLDVKFARSMII